MIPTSPTRRAAAAGGAALLAAGLAAAGAAGAATPSTEHVPGELGYGVDVAADAVDTNTGETHPCAGRKLAYRSHVDAIYATHMGGELTTAVVDGQAVVPADEVCLRLAPDADENGVEVSRMVVPPDTPALSFLGEPGEILWNAPQTTATFGEHRWRPVWAGVGAFDPSHELGDGEDLPATVELEITELDGPGEVHTYFYNRGSDTLDHIFSAPDDPKFTLNVGGHNHMNWTFTEPGVYRLTVEAKMTMPDGTVEASEPTVHTWLVGSDEQVGLEPGTTEGLNDIEVPAEKVRDELVGPPEGEGGDNPPAGGETEGGKPGEGQPGEDKPGAGEGQRPGEGTPPPKESAPTLPVERCRLALSWAEAVPSRIVDKGHVDLGVRGGKGGVEGVATVDGKAASTDYKPEDVAFAVNDSAVTRVPERTARQLGVDLPRPVWQVPLSQLENPDVPWVGFSTTGLAPEDVEGDVRLSLADVEGPGRIITMRSGISSAERLLDSEQPDREIRLAPRNHEHHAMWFTKPGVYRATFLYRLTPAGGDLTEVPVTTTFLVGDDTIDLARPIVDGKAPLGSCAGGPGPKPGGQQGDGGGHGPQGGDGTPGTRPGGHGAAPGGAHRPGGGAQHAGGGGSTGGGSATGQPFTGGVFASGQAPAAAPAPGAAGGGGGAPAQGSNPPAAQPPAEEGLSDLDGDSDEDEGEARSKAAELRPTPFGDEKKQPVKENAAPAEPEGTLATLTRGGWLAGLLIGLGASALVAGVWFFAHATLALRRARSELHTNATLAAAKRGKDAKDGK